MAFQDSCWSHGYHLRRNQEINSIRPPTGDSWGPLRREGRAPSSRWIRVRTPALGSGVRRTV